MNQLKLFRPSSAPALELCTHYENTIDPSPNKHRGAGFHAIIAQCLQVRSKGEPVTPAMCGQFLTQCDFAMSVQSDLIPHIKGIEYEVTLYEDCCENHPVEIPKERHFITSGTIDLWGLADRPAIIDWKTGQERNYSAQLAVYGVGLLEERGDTEIDLHTVFVDQERVISETCTLDELRERVDMLVEAVRDPASPYAINSYCGRCDLRDHGCSAWTHERQLVQGFLPDPSLSLQERFAVLKQDPEKLARFIVAFRRLKNMVEKVEHLDQVALGMIQGGATMPGLQKITRKGSESIKPSDIYGLIQKLFTPTLNDEDLDLLLTVDLEQAKKLWPKYMSVRFPKTKVSNPTEYIVLKK